VDSVHGETRRISNPRRRSQFDIRIYSFRPFDRQLVLLALMSTTSWTCSSMAYSQERSTHKSKQHKLPVEWSKAKNGYGNGRGQYATKPSPGSLPGWEWHFEAPWPFSRVNGGQVNNTAGNYLDETTGHLGYAHNGNPYSQEYLLRGEFPDWTAAMSKANARRVAASARCRNYDHHPECNAAESSSHVDMDRVGPGTGEKSHLLKDSSTGQRRDHLDAQDREHLALDGYDTDLALTGQAIITLWSLHKAKITIV
jgi:hypothetical protein